jgi:Ran GTPase-activating protein (RanGAP) involved in mRNA processing and transport
VYLLVVSCACVKLRNNSNTSFCKFSNLQFLASNFQKCYRNQPDLNECLLKATQNGISQLTRAYDEVNIPNLHPLEVSEVSIGAGTGPVAVDQEFKDCKLDGFHKMKLDNVE